MDNKQARKTGRTIMCCGCVLIVLTKIYIGIAMIVVGLLFSLLLGRCPHCGKFLIGPEGGEGCVWLKEAETKESGKEEGI